MIQNFEKLDFNRKIDVLVAVYVFGWDDITIYADGDYFICTGVQVQKGSRAYEVILNYSILLTSAWEIVQKFDYLYLFRGGKKWMGGKWECKLVWGDTDKIDDKLYGWAETEMLAICYAGLKAVGFNVEGFLKEEGKV